MHIHFAIDKDDVSVYVELMNQLKELGHKITHGLKAKANVDMVICRGDTTTIPAHAVKKLEKSLKRAKTSVEEFNKKRARSRRIVPKLT